MSEPRDIEKDKLMCEAATAGPWKMWSRGEIISETDLTHDHVFYARTNGELAISEPDQWFIASSRTALPYYITQYEAAQKEVERMTRKWAAAEARVSELEQYNRRLLAAVPDEVLDELKVLEDGTP